MTETTASSLSMAAPAGPPVSVTVPASPVVTVIYPIMVSTPPGTTATLALGSLLRGGLGLRARRTA